MLFREGKDRALQHAEHDRTSASSITKPIPLEPPLEISSPVNLKTTRAKDPFDETPKARHVRTFLHDSPDTIMYERTVNSIYDSYGGGREGVVEVSIRQDHSTSPPSHLVVKPRPLVTASSPSSARSVSGTTGAPNSNMSTAPVSPDTKTLERALSKHSFASDTHLLSRHQDNVAFPAQSLQPPQLGCSTVRQHSDVLAEAGGLGVHGGQILHRTPLRRQGTDDHIRAVLTYDQNPTYAITCADYAGEEALDSVYNDGDDLKGGQLGLDSKDPEERYGHAPSTNTPLIALRKASGRRRWFPDPKWGFLILVIAETVINIGIEGNILFRFSHAIDSNTATSIVTQNKVRLPVYLSIFAMAHLFQLLLAIDATIFRNTIQIIGLSIFNGLFLVYAVIQMDEIKEILGTAQDGSKITGETAYSILHVSVAVQTAIILGVIAAAEVGFLILSWYIYKDFGWEIYQDLGADLSIKRYYLHHQIFVCVIRFASFFFVGFGVQFIFLVLPETDPEYYITIAALPVSIMLLLTGVIGAHFENVWAMGGFLIGMVGGLGYFVFKTYRIYNQRAMYHQVYRSLTTFSGLSMLILAVSLVWACIVMSNFGKGLREQRVRARVRKGKRGGKAGKTSGPTLRGGQHELEVVRRRMTLD